MLVFPFHKTLYWPSLLGQDGWILASFCSFRVFLDLDAVLAQIKRKRTWPIVQCPLSHLDLTLGRSVHAHSDVSVRCYCYRTAEYDISQIETYRKINRKVSKACGLWGIVTESLELAPDLISEGCGFKSCSIWPRSRSWFPSSTLQSCFEIAKWSVSRQLRFLSISLCLVGIFVSLKGLGHAILGHALGHAILGNFSTDQIVIELTKIRK